MTTSFGDGRAAYRTQISKDYLFSRKTAMAQRLGNINLNASLENRVYIVNQRDLYDFTM